jgi:hypothetical protein
LQIFDLRVPVIGPQTYGESDVGRRHRRIGAVEPLVRRPA